MHGHFLHTVLLLCLSCTADGSRIHRDPVKGSASPDDQTTTPQAPDVHENDEEASVAISQLTKDEIQRLISKDKNFLLQVQKDVLYILSMKRRLPEEFSKKFKYSDKKSASMGAMVDGATSATLTLAGLSEIGDLGKLALQVAKDYKYAKLGWKVYHGAALFYAARAQLLVSGGRAMHTHYARDVSFGQLYQAYRRTWKAVANTFYATSQDWFLYKGKRKGQFNNVPPYVYRDLAHLDEPVASLQDGEYFIIDRVQEHEVPNGGGDGWEVPDIFGNASQLQARYEYPLQQGVLGHLGDGRGWVRLDMPTSFGGAGAIYGSKETIKVSKMEARRKCDDAMRVLNSTVLPEGAGLDMFRHAASKTKEITDNLGFQIGFVGVGVGLGALAFFSPPAAATGIVAGGTALALTKTGVQVGANVAFEQMIDPIIMYVLSALADFEFDVFNPEMKPRSGKGLCDFDKEWLSEFRSTIGSSERIPCDIVSNKCGEGMFCMRSGIFTRTTGRMFRKGYCMEASWAQADNGQICGQDHDCKSGACLLGKMFPHTETSMDQSSFQRISKALGANSLNSLTPSVKSMLGVCVEPCDPKDLPCTMMSRGSEFGYRMRRHPEKFKDPLSPDEAYEEIEDESPEYYY